MKQPSNTLKSEAAIDWSQVQRVLLIRLRSIGDTVLMTPCLTVLKGFRSDLRLTVLTETLVAPLLEDHPQVDELIVLNRTASQVRDGWERLRLVRRLRHARFDVAFNLHGGTTATLLGYLSRARHRVGYRGYRSSFLHTVRAPNPEVVWQKSDIHSVEQQLGLLKWAGVSIPTLPNTWLSVTRAALESIDHRLTRAQVERPFALIHPAAASEDKRWPTAKFAEVIKHLSAMHGLASVVIGARHETHLLDNLKGFAGRSVCTFTDLNLKEAAALCARARLFIGNDSGPAHIAMATGCPTIVIFGASDPRVWRPWGTTAHAFIQVVTDPTGRRLAPPGRIAHVQVEAVAQEIDRLIRHTVRHPDQLLGFDHQAVSQRLSQVVDSST